MVRLCALLVVAMMFVSSAVAFAHPGHGTTPPGSLAHYVFEPVHAVVLIAAAAGIVLLARLHKGGTGDRASKPRQRR